MAKVVIPERIIPIREKTVIRSSYNAYLNQIRGKTAEQITQEVVVGMRKTETLDILQDFFNNHLRWEVLAASIRFIDEATETDKTRWSMILELRDLMLANFTPVQSAEPGVQIFTNKENVLMLRPEPDPEVVLDFDGKPVPLPVDTGQYFEFTDPKPLGWRPDPAKYGVKYTPTLENAATHPVIQVPSRIIYAANTGEEYLNFHSSIFRVLPEMEFYYSVFCAWYVDLYLDDAYLKESIADDATRLIEKQQEEEAEKKAAEAEAAKKVVAAAAAPAAPAKGKKKKK